MRGVGLGPAIHPPELLVQPDTPSMTGRDLLGLAPFFMPAGVPSHRIDAGTRYGRASVWQGGLFHGGFHGGRFSLVKLSHCKKMK
jgi:hypothetical protein